MMIAKILSRVLGKMYLFIVPYAPVTDSFSKRENSATIMTMWLVHFFLYILTLVEEVSSFNFSKFYSAIWPYDSSSIRSLLNPNVHIAILFIAISAIIAYKISGKYTGKINESDISVTKKVIFLICFVIFGVSAVLLRSGVGIIILTVFHLTAFVYFYFTKSTFGLKLDEQAALDKNGS